MNIKFFFSSRRRHTRLQGDWSSDVCSSDLVVVDEKGKKTEWSVEGGSPNSLSRQGWRATTFKPGEVVTVRIAPMKDGTAARSEERRVGKESRSGWGQDSDRKEQKKDGSGRY